MKKAAYQLLLEGKEVLDNPLISDLLWLGPLGVRVVEGLENVTAGEIVFLGRDANLLSALISIITIIGFNPREG